MSVLHWMTVLNLHCMCPVLQQSLKLLSTETPQPDITYSCFSIRLDYEMVWRRRSLSMYIGKYSVILLSAIGY